MHAAADGAQTGWGPHLGCRKSPLWHGNCTRAVRTSTWRKGVPRLAISYFTSQAKRHWLTDVAEAAGLHDLKLPPRAPFDQVRAAWAEISRSTRVSEEALAERVAAHFRLKVADLSTAEPQTAKLLPEKVARRHGLLPLRASDQVIVVATADPVSIEAEQDVRAAGSGS